MIRLAILLGIFAPFFLLLAIAESSLSATTIALAIFTVGFAAGVTFGLWLRPQEPDPHFHQP